MPTDEFQDHPAGSGRSRRLAASRDGQDGARNRAHPESGRAGVSERLRRHTPRRARRNSGQRSGPSRAVRIRPAEVRHRQGSAGGARHRSGARRERRRRPLQLLQRGRARAADRPQSGAHRLRRLRAAGGRAGANLDPGRGNHRPSGSGLSFRSRIQGRRLGRERVGHRPAASRREAARTRCENGGLVQDGGRRAAVHPSRPRYARRARRRQHDSDARIRQAPELAAIRRQLQPSARRGRRLSDVQGAGELSRHGSDTNRIGLRRRA